ncbi:MAG: DUF3857 domain-containing protein [Chitinophagales bacterium]|nr:DUF3857 domain-containing protein [Chitinophagales bacterium]
MTPTPKYISALFTLSLGIGKYLVKQATVLFLLLFCSYIWAQQPIHVADTATLRRQYPDDYAAYLLRSEHLRIDYSNKVWDITKDITEEMVCLHPLGQVYGSRSLVYSGFEQLSDIEAQTFVPIKKGNKMRYDTYRVEHIEDKNVMAGGIFYSDYKEKEFVFPAFTPGATAQLQYRETTQEPHLLTPFFFASNAPTLRAEFSVTVPPQVKISYKLLGENADSLVQFSRSTDGAMTTYTWVMTNVNKLEGEESAPNISYYTPHLVILINEGKALDGTTQTVLNDEKGLYQWYSSLVKDVNQQTDETLQHTVNEIIQGAKSDAEKSRRIFAWVQKNIKYIAFEDGLGGFVPREAKDILLKKYGDCKDMSSITVAMHRSAGIPAYLTWIGTRDKPYTYRQLPAPIVDNHMIACAKIDGKDVFLDATGSYLPFGLPTSMIQGKEALVGIDADRYEILTVPIIDKENNRSQENIRLRIEDKTLKGKAELELMGYKKTFMEYDRLKAQADKDPLFFSRRLQKGSNKFGIEQINDNGFFDPNKAIRINYDFVIPDYVKQAGNKLYVNLSLDRKYKSAEMDLKKRKTDRESEYKYVENNQTTLDIPEGYTVEYLPPNSHYDGDLFGYSVSYRQKDKTIEMEQKIYINFLILKRDHFAEWNKMIRQLTNAYQESAVLKK